MVHLAVYFHFTMALVGRQWVQVTKVEGQTLFSGGTDPEELDLYVPIFLIVEFLFYLGWLNVASTLYNPFGDDDDDFELMGLMNRHIKVCMRIVDDDGEEIPEVQEDAFWRRPEGGAEDWTPSLEQRVEVRVEGREEEGRGEGAVQRKWSQMSRRAVGLEGQEGCSPPGTATLAESRDPGRPAHC